MLKRFKYPRRQCQNAALNTFATRHESGERETNLSLCTGAGKSRIELELPNTLTRPPSRTIYIFPSLALVKQFYTDYVHPYFKTSHSRHVRYFATDGTLTEVQRFNPTTQLDEQKQVLLTTFASAPTLFPLLNETRTADLVIVDEAHHITGPQYAEAFTNATPYIRHCVHLSATLPEGKTPHYRYPILQGIHDGVIRDFNIELFIGKQGEKEAFTEMMEKMVEVHSGDGRPVKALVYTKFAETGNSSVRSFMEEYSGECRWRGWWIEGITAEDAHDERFDRLREFETNTAEVSILVSCRTLSEGVDLAGANVMIPWDPTASIVDNIQRIGRVLRMYREERGGEFCAEQPPSTILIPVWLDPERYEVAREAGRAEVARVLEEDINLGERGNFQPIMNVCAALKSELADEDQDLFNQILAYPCMPPPPKVRFNSEVIERVADAVGKEAEEVRDEVADALEEMGEEMDAIDEEVVEGVRQEGNWDDAVSGAVMEALVKTQDITLRMKDGMTEDVYGEGECVVNLKRDRSGQKRVKTMKMRSGVAGKAGAKRVQKRLGLRWSEGCRVMLGIDEVVGNVPEDLSDLDGIVIGRVSAKIEFEGENDERWENTRLEQIEWVRENGGKIPSRKSKDPTEKRLV